jgi:crotonobetainyl-CoA:carnitine CoA-transferase CaiB-like acyl-CoA transferase
MTRTALLAGVRVLELAPWRPGPLAGQLLTQLGAEVVKVEPAHGDPFRGYPSLFASHNAGKRSVVLDLRSPSGVARALELARDADVVLEGWRPGVAAKLGVSYDDICVVNPSVIYCSISGFGQDGPWAAVPGHDLAYQAFSGLIGPRPGQPPASNATPIGDLTSGLFGAFTVAAALHRRALTGEGEYIDVAMTSLLATFTGLGEPGNLGEVEIPPGGIVSYGNYRTADGGWVAFSFMEDVFWDRLAQAWGRDDLVGLTMRERIEREGELREWFVTECAARTRDDLVALGEQADVPIAPVLSRAEMLAADHLRHVGAVVDGPAGPWLGFPARLRHHPPVIAFDAPACGEHDGWAPA